MVNVARLDACAAAPLLNAPVAALAASPRLGKMLRRNVTFITYTGRRSGRTFSIPVAFRRDGDEIAIVTICPTPRRGGTTSSATARQCR